MDEDTVLEHHELDRDGKHLLTLSRRPRMTSNHWKIRHHHAYEGGGGFGYNPSFNDEAEARAYYAQKLDEERAKHEQWLAEQDNKDA